MKKKPTQSGMTCPICDSKGAVFQTVDKITVHGVVENWRMDDVGDQIARQTDREFICVKCDGRVHLDLIRREVTPTKDRATKRVVIFDEWVRECMERLRKKKDATIPRKIVEQAKAKGFDVDPDQPYKGADLLRVFVLNEPDS